METREVLELILGRMRAVNRIFEKSSAGKLSYDQISEKLSEIMNANVYILSAKGKILGVYYEDIEDSTAVCDQQSNVQYMPEHENEEYLKIEETVIREDAFSDLTFFPKKASHKPHMATPVYGGGIRQGTIVFARYNQSFDLEDIILAEHVATAIGVELERRKKRAIEEKNRKEAAAQLALEGLTYSEQVVVKDIILRMESDTELIVASKVADQAKVARTLVVSAIRKLEGAGMIESRSFGSKGTQIKLLNDKFRDKVMKLKDL